MGRHVKLGRLQSHLADRSYPVHRDVLADEYADTTVEFADGEGNLGELIDETGVDAFESAEDVVTSLQNVLPVEAVGEPGQSEGDA